MNNFYQSRQNWLKKANRRPALNSTTVEPLGLVVPLSDPAAWQRCRMQPGAAEKPFNELYWEPGNTFYLDFGRHLVGYLQLALSTFDRIFDAPVRVRFTFAELPYECTAPGDSYHGTLCRSWVQDEIVNFDEPGQLYRLPRRYAFRYLKIEVLTGRSAVRFDQLQAVAVSSAGELPKTVKGEFGEIDRVGLQTLHSCMQEVFEDGPKRDRRLWLGDLRLQAMVNAVSFRNFKLVERCLYLLAGNVDETGLVPGAVFDRNPPRHGSLVIDYALLLGPTLLDHLKFSGREAICRELYPLALHQLELVRPHFDRNGIFQDPGKWWNFIDHCLLLDRQMPLQGVYIYACRRMAELAELLGESGDALREEADRLSAAVRKHHYDRVRGVIISGKSKQLSWASQTWMILAGVLTPEEGTRALAAVEADADAVRPQTPYLWHHVVEAYYQCGQTAKVLELIRTYWGGMVRHGADTFWEAYVPANDFFSPYHDVLMNSACHAWSCTPSYFLRRHQLQMPEPKVAATTMV